MFEFGWLWLLALLPAPLLIRALPARQQNDAALRVPFFNQVHSIGPSTHTRGKNIANYGLLWLIWALCVIAAADPRWLGEAKSLPYSGRDLMLAVDISKSMDEKDMLPLGVTSMQFQNRSYDRLDAVKAVIGNFTEHRQGDRLGLILFADKAYLQAPLTYDTATVNQLLQEAQIGFAGAATAIGDALGLAIKRLKDRPEGSRRIILLSDGANTAGQTEPMDAAQKARDMGVKIYTIGFGADEQIVQTIRGPRRYNPSRDLDEHTLQEIAKVTGGQYFRARTTEELELIHQRLDALEPIELDELKVRPSKRLFFWPLGLALFITGLLALRFIPFSRKSSHTHNGTFVDTKS
ncbi:VWA domain-containing protein [Gilvimarinus polysaccharolyticus]|uniref:VWA domain-containing protein n=1 Tax=Gilvimarinus polysaccharolyticus TaxID=863921 RepID=UPI0006732F2D|nr:VWA domain-containing protein [Gilvimarinus polysaccharolyticus]